MTVTIAGAGIVGCAIARELAARGARVRVLDPRGVGDGATRASAGILAPHIEGHSAALLGMCLCSLDAYDNFIERVRSESRQPIEYERTGTLQVARDAVEAAELQQTAEALRSRGVAHVQFGPGDLKREEPALAEGMTAALLVPQHGYVAVGALTAALADAARRHGAAFSRRRVLRIDTGPAGVRVLTDEETIDCDAAIVAAGSWSGQIAAAAGPPVLRPIRGQLLQLQAAARTASRVIWGSQCYLVPWQDGSVLVGATVEDVGFDERTTVGGVQYLMEGARALVPVLAGAAVDRLHAGLRPMAADELPIIGRSSTMAGVFYATGHYRNGVLLAPLTASLMADLVLDGRERPELDAVRPDRFGL